VRHSLRFIPSNPPIGQFGYSNSDADVLAAILRKATGQSPLEYARSHLFDPLHIRSAQASQLLVRPEGLAAFKSATGFVWLADPKRATPGAVRSQADRAGSAESGAVLA
jgi:CubicO group peptidase (beta-lactamase class C family)